MTTKNSPRRLLKKQATVVARHLKSGKAPRRPDGKVKFGIVMDDKTLTVTWTWADIDKTTEAALVEFILKKMAEDTEQ